MTKPLCHSLVISDRMLRGASHPVDLLKHIIEDVNGMPCSEGRVYIKFLYDGSETPQLSSTHQMLVEVEEYEREGEGDAE